MVHRDDLKNYAHAELRLPEIEYGEEQIRVFAEDLLEDVLLNTPRSAERLKRLVSNAEIRVLDGVGHIILDQGNTVTEFALGNQPDLPAEKPTG